MPTGVEVGLGMGVAYGVPWTPAALSPSVWLEAAAGYLWKERDGSRATPAAADGDPVGQARDRFTPAAYYTAPSLSARPTLRVVSGVWWLQFDAADDVLAFAGAAFPGPFTAYAAARRDAVDSILLPLAAAASTFLGVYLDATSYFITDAGANVSAAYGGPNAADVLFRWRRTAADSVRLRYTGAAEVTMGTRAGAFTPTQVGARGAGEVTSGRVGAVIACAADLSAGDQALAEAYLNAGWGVSL